MNISKYLKRIKFNSPLDINLNTLVQLQKAHLVNIPFENLDIHSNTPIELNIEKIYDKIINQNRGGFCYELNGLFHTLLQSIGFNARMISARAYNAEKEYGEEYDHLAIIVELEDKEYLVDVGFGRFAFTPLEITLGLEQETERGIFLFDKYDEAYFRINRKANGEWIPEYIFKRIKREFQEFKKMCQFHQTDPASHFIQKRLITIPTYNGRITISANQLKIRRGKIIEERNIDDFEFDKLLIKYFNFKDTE